MKLFNVKMESLQAAVLVVSQLHFDGNLKFKQGPVQETRNCIRFGLTVNDSSARGSRRSATGRRVAAACWHMHRDVMLVLFARFPNARLKTMLADYNGLQDFTAKFFATGQKNIGSNALKCKYSEACNCREFAETESRIQNNIIETI